MYIHIVMEKEQEEWKTRLKNEEIRKKKFPPLFTIKIELHTRWV